MQIDIKKLTPSLAQDFLGFFDDDAFSDNPDWSGCYCSFFYFGDDEWNERTGSMNRDFSEQAIISGSINGYLAYVDGKPAGWINADRKEAYARLEQNGGDKKVLSIVCFTVSPGHRRKGIAGKLLQAALEGAKREGYEAVEAYPAKEAATDAHNYHGPLELYTKNGFEVAEEKKDNYIVRKRLRL